MCMYVVYQKTLFSVPFTELSVTKGAEATKQIIIVTVIGNL